MTNPQTTKDALVNAFIDYLDYSLSQAQQEVESARQDFGMQSVGFNQKLGAFNVWSLVRQEAETLR